MISSVASEPQPRLGIALSGGGFRASLFHIGVLARLAELDLLREVQVISTVSGGSIIGALYYLHVRRLLEAKPDKDIKRDDYIALVDELWKTFSVAIESNLRMRTLADWRANLRMIYSRRYSRSDRMAELYEAHLYAGLVGVTPPDRVSLPSLTIAPHGEPNFHPFEADAQGRTGNDRRENKVPVLIINATTLNTGHSFQFTATWMGEPPSLAHAGDLDRNLRLRRAYYGPDRLPDKYASLPLGVAVAASAAVPGIFPPLALTDLYRDGADEFTPQLVDGGVHDNQGIGGLLDPGHPCTHLIVSDASGQMHDVCNPVTETLAVLKRSNDALMDRVREEEYAVARLLKERSGASGLSFFHLKDGLRQRELTWIGGADKPLQVQDCGETTPQGVHPRVQELLADIRTDLDAFSEIESHALMADGYLIARCNVDAAFRHGFDRRGSSESEHPWGFMDVQPYMADPDYDPSFADQLEVGSRTIGKCLRMVPFLRWTANPLVRLAAFVIAAGAIIMVVQSHGALLFGFFAVVALTLAARVIARVRHWPWLETAARIASAIVPGLISAPLWAFGVNRHLCILTPLRLRYGRVDRLRPVSSARIQREAA